MYNKDDIQFNGKHDYDKVSALDQSINYPNEDFSINIFQWILSTDGKRLKQGKGKVRVHGTGLKIDEMLSMAESVVNRLDLNDWDGRKNIFIK